MRSRNTLENVIDTILRDEYRFAGGPVAWRDVEMPDGATAIPATMFPPADCVGHLCRLAANVSTTDQNVYPAGAIFECTAADERGRLTIYGHGLRLIHIPREALEVILR